MSFFAMTMTYYVMTTTYYAMYYLFLPYLYDERISKQWRSSKNKDFIETDKITVKYKDVESKIDKAFVNQNKIIDEIFGLNEETLDDVYDLIVKSDENKDFLFGIVEYALNIRPKQRKTIFDLICRLVSKYPYLLNKKFSNDVRQFLILKGILPREKNEEKQKTLDELINIYPKGSIERIIFDDDIESFIKLEDCPGFFPNEARTAFDDDYLYFFFAKNEILFPPKHDYSYHYPYMSFGFPSLAAFYGSVKIFKYMIMNEDYNIFSDEFAIASGNKEIINILKEKGSTFDNCLELAVKYHRHDLCQFLLDNSKCPVIDASIAQNCYNYRAFFFMELNYKSFDKKYLSVSLVEAGGTGNVPMIQYLLDEGADIDGRDEIDGKTALIYAAYYNHFPAIQLLIKNKADVRIKTNNREYTAILVAARNGSLPIVEEIMKVSKYKETDVRKNTALHFAAKCGNVELIKFLVQNGYSANTRNKMGKTPLHEASVYGKLEAVQYLVEKCKADPSLKDLYAFIPIFCAAENNHLPVIKYLMNNYKTIIGKIDCGGKNLLHVAAGCCDSETVRYIINEGFININQQDSEKKVPIFFAYGYNNYEVLKILINEGKAKMHYKNYEYNKTLLMQASEDGHLDIVNAILAKSRAGINIKDILGRTALYLACKMGHLEVVKALVERGKADIEIAENGNRTPLFIAANYEHFPIVKYLIDRNADVNAVDFQDLTPMQIALKFHNQTIADYIAQHGGH